MVLYDDVSVVPRCQCGTTMVSIWYLDDVIIMSLVVLCNLQSPELVARLQKLRAMQEQREYDRMVRNIDPAVSECRDLMPTASSVRCNYEFLCF